MFTFRSESDGRVVKFRDGELTRVAATNDKGDDVHVVETANRFPVDVCDEMVLP